MATQADVRRIALALPGAVEDPNHFAFSVPHKGRLKGFAWVWLERLAPKRARVPQPRVLAVRVANLAEKDLMLQLEPERFFTEPHYDGYPAVLIHLPLMSVRELRPILAEAWRCQAPKELTGGAPPATRKTRVGRRRRAE